MCYQHRSHLLAAFFLLFFLPGCSSLSLPFSNSINPDNLPETLRVGLATDTPPLSYRDKSQAVRGLDPQLAAGLKAYAQREVIYVPLPRKALLEALENNEVDIVMAGLNASEAKRLDLAATKGYLQTGLAPLMLLGKQNQLTGADGLKAANLRIGTVLGSSGPEYVRSLKTKGTHQIFASMQAGVDALLRERIDVLIHDMPAIFHYASLHIEQGLTPSTSPLTREEIVWAMRPKDKDLRLLMDAYLQGKKEDGSLAAIITRSLPFYGETGLFPEK